MVTDFWLECITNWPSETLHELIRGDEKFIQEAPQFLSPYPDDDFRGSPELRKAIENAKENVLLMKAELEFRRQPGPRDWSPRGPSGIRR